MSPVDAVLLPERADAAAELDQRRLEVVAEQAVGLRWQVLSTSVFIAVIAWNAIAPAWTVAWLVAMVVLREARAAAIVRMRNDRVQPIAERLRKLIWWNAGIGAAHGSGALFMLGLDTSRDALLTMILVSLGAGAVSTASTVMPAFIAYASFLFIPTAALWFARLDLFGLGVGALVLMFFSVQIRFARANLRTFEESFRIRLENDHLARSLGAERVEQARARDAAIQANLEKSRFLAAASHDLRQPLQAMALNTGELGRLEFEPHVKLIVDDVGKSVDELRGMLDALLDVSQLDGGVVVPRVREFFVDRLVGGVAGSFRAAAAARGLVFAVDCPAGIGVRTDPDLLRRILANLVDNACKFTPSGSVTLGVTVAQSDVEISVRDTGIGIAPENHRRVFDDLVQLHNAGRDRSQGHGLGLGIVRRVADLLGIRITMESAVGAGTTFRMRVARTAPPPSDGGAHGAAPIEARRILVLDDDDSVRAAFAAALRGLGCDVRAVATSAEALSCASERGFELALIDFRLREGESGLRTAQDLRAICPTLPVVMVTADVDPDLVQEASAQGFLILRKPVDLPTLARTIAAMTESALRKAAPEEQS